MKRENLIRQQKLYDSFIFFIQNHEKKLDILINYIKLLADENTEMKYYLNNLNAKITNININCQNNINYFDFIAISNDKFISCELLKFFS